MAIINRDDLGNTYRDPISGWEGIATARYDYLNGCVLIEISGADKDGKPDSYVFDEQQLVQVLGEPVPVAIPEPPPPKRWPRRTGGSQSNRPVPR